MHLSCGFLEQQILLVTSNHKKTDVIISHIGTTDLTKGVNTIKEVKKVAESIQKLDTDESIKTGFLSIINLDDVDKLNDVNKVNDLLQKFCESKCLLFVVIN